MDFSPLKYNLQMYIHRQVVSVEQDTIYCTSKALIQTPKHILLPMTLHNMTGSKSLFTLINHLVHGISYAELEGLQTAMAESHLSQNNADDVYLSNINPAQKFSLCFDNNDINEETLSGSGITHCTNGNAIQRQVDFNFSSYPLLFHLCHVKNIGLTQVQYCALQLIKCVFS